MSNFGLRSRKGAIKKVKFATFDIESSNWVNFKLLGFFDGNKYYEFYNVEDFLNHILHKKYREFKIFAHNGGRFDFRFILEKTIDKYRINIIEVHGSLIQLRVYLGSGRDTVTFRDSYVLLPASLRELTETFNVEHKKKKIENYNFDILTDKKREYLKFDCLGLYEVLSSFQILANKQGANLRLSLASTSMDLFLRKYFPKDLPYIPNYRHREKIIRQAYFGGRTEALNRYGENLFYYDFNSLYPAVMAENLFPVGNPAYIKHYKFNKNDIGFCNIRTDLPERFIMPLPYRLNSMLTFPYGIINGYYPIVFLNMLKKLNIDFTINEALLFTGKSIFKDFVNNLYKLRLENTGNALGYVLKTMLNSLYGKFGQHILQKEYIQNPTEKQLIGLTIYDIDLNLWYKEKEITASYILPALSAYVTAYGQEKIFTIMNELQTKVYYCDTDSIVTTEKLPTSTNLGELKLEYIIKRGIFLTQKLYAFIDHKGKFHYRAKGYSKNDMARNSLHFTWDDFERALDGDFSAFKIEYECLFGFKESLKRFNKMLYYGKKQKSIIDIETKRIFLKNSFLTKPLHLIEQNSIFK